MLNKKVLIKFLFVFVFIVPLATVSEAQINEANGLLADIPEPPNAKTELPSPVPMVYRFMGALMDGEYDTCLSNFDVQTFLELLHGKALTRLEKEEQDELMAYQIQTHRNEFRFLSKVMNRVAGGAKIDYSDPRYHGKVQSKIVIRLDTNRGRFDFQVFCRYTRGRWYVYDYILNNQRLTQTFRDSIKGLSVNAYLDSLRPFYEPFKGTRPLRSKTYEFSMLVPSNYQLRENISPSLLATLSALNGQFLLHVQAANYETPQNLAQVGKAIKETLMPFNPRLYDQWKGDIAGVEVGNILFHFTQGNRLLYCHMVLIPLGKKLVVFNFYHSTLQIMKHMSNVRDTMIRSLSLPRIEAAGGVAGRFADEVTVPNPESEFGDGGSFSSSTLDFDDNSFNNDSTFDNDNGFSESENNPSESDDEDDEDVETNIPTSYNDDESNDEEDEDNLDWESSSSSSNNDDDDDNSLRPDTYVQSSDDDEEEEEEDYKPSLPKSGGGYGSGSYDDDDDYGFDSGNDVSF